MTPELVAENAEQVASRAFLHDSAVCLPAERLDLSNGLRSRHEKCENLGWACLSERLGCTVQRRRQCIYP